MMDKNYDDDNDDHDNDGTRFEIIIPVRPRAPAGLALPMRSGSTIRRPSLIPVDVRSIRCQSAPHNRDLRVYRGSACWAGGCSRNGTCNASLLVQYLGLD